MTINELLILINPFIQGNNQFSIDLHQMNTIGGKKYYENLINHNVLSKYGVYALCDSNEMKVLYIGKGGTVNKNRNFKNQTLNGRLKAPRGTFNNSYEYFKHIMNENDFKRLIFVVAYSDINNPPAYIEAICLHQYLKLNNCLPIFNNEF
jgi:hypothetical protein